MKKIISIVFVLLFFAVSAHAQIRPGLVNVAEEDGNPSVWVYKILFSNGSLTNNEDGTASVSITGSGMTEDGDYTPTGTWVWTSATVTWPTFNQNTSGNAATATALAADPADCAAGQVATGIAASGALSCTATPTLTSVTLAKQSGVAGDMGLYEANSTDTHAAGFRGPASITGDGAYRVQFPNARAAAAGQVLATTNAGESGTGTAADPYVQTGSWITPATLSGDQTFTGSNTIGDGGDDQRIVMRINATNERWSGNTIYFAQCAASMAFGTAAYIQSTGKPGLADADGAATMPAIGLVVVASVNADDPCTILTHGVITDTDWNWTPGNTIYVADGATSGLLTATIGDISDENDVVQVIGIALHADTIFVNPSLAVAVLAAP